MQALLDASEHVQEHLSQQIDIERIGRDSAEQNVTRLQAENAALQQRLTIADQLNDDLQSNLTKARELLLRAVPSVYGDDEKEIRDFLAPQSAPADDEAVPDG